MRVAAAALLMLAGPWASVTAGAAEYRSLGERPAILYDAPSSKADRLFIAARYYPFEVVVKLDQWVKVRDANGEVGWVEGSALAPPWWSPCHWPMCVPHPIRSRPSCSKPTSRCCSRCSSRPRKAG